jgi:hypothetical protein
MSVFDNQGSRSGLSSWVLLGALAIFWAHPASSAPPAKTGAKAACAATYEQAQERRENGKLRQAHELLLSCAKETCGAAVAQQCRAALPQLEADMPSVIPVVTDRNGGHLVDVRVSVDGEALTSLLDGRGLIVDPGLHEFAFSTDRGVFHTEKLMIVEGQRNRLISVQSQLTSAKEASPSSAPAVAAPAAPDAEAVPEPVTKVEAKAERTAPRDASMRAEPGRSIVPYIIGGAGVAAVGTSLLLAHWGREDNLLLDRCEPNCKQESVDHVSNLFIAADVTLGVGVLALGAATWLYLTDSGSEQPPSERAYRFDVKPMPSGGYASVRGAF